MNRRPTPETDAMCICTHHKSFAATGGVVNPDFARRLEIERDEARSDLEFRRNLFKLQEQQLNEVIVENKRLKALLDEKEEFIQRVITWPHDADPFTSPDHDNDSRNYQ